MTDAEMVKAMEICKDKEIPCDDCPLVECGDCGEISRQYFYDRFNELKVENAALRERLEKAYEFPAVKYGDKIWVLDGKHLFDRYVWAIEIKSNGVFLSLSEKTMWFDRGIVSLSERGKTWFLDSEKELAEARLAELKGGKNE